jgi:hypothetical protein
VVLLLALVLLLVLVFVSKGVTLPAEGTVGACSSSSSSTRSILNAEFAAVSMVALSVGHSLSSGSNSLVWFFQSSNPISPVGPKSL